MSQRDTRFDAKPTQIEWRAGGGGYVDLVLLNGRNDASRVVVATLAYPQSGTMIGEPPRDVQNAAKLNEAATRLNDVLRELCS